MPQINQITFRVADPEAQVRFYCDVLGMQRLGADCVGYGGAQAALRFIKAEGVYTPRPTDMYWKIALSVPNLELAHQQLAQAGIACSEPRQFEDVRYLAHFADPEGFPIELLDHAFKGERDTAGHEPDAFGGGAHLSLLTLRTADIAADEPTLLGWGMRKLSVQPLTDYGFDLHFYALTDEEPPNAELTAVENRTWVYQRPYTVLELQRVNQLSETTDTDRYVGALIAGPEAKAGFPNGVGLGQTPVEVI